MTRRAAPEASRGHVGVPDRRARKLEAPKAPWAPAPLTEIAILLGMICVVAGFLVGAASVGPLLAVGFGLISVASLELAAREHRAGYKSHSTILALTVAVLIDAPLYLFTSIPYQVLLIVGVAVFLAAFGGLRRAFAQATGGLGFRG